LKKNAFTNFVQDLAADLMESIEEHYKFRQMISCRNKLMPKLLISQSALNFSKRI